jgi:hypothetical protein
MSAPIIVPRDTSLEEALASDQVHMLIIGSSERASELAILAGQVSGREEFGSESPRCAVQVTSPDVLGDALCAALGDTPDAAVVVLGNDGSLVSISRETVDFDRIDLEALFLEAGA